MSTLIDTFVEKFSIEALTDFFRKASKNFKKEQESFDYILKNKEEYASFSNLQKVGSIAFKDADELIIFTCSYNGELSERSSKKRQYDIAKTILKNDFKDGAIFVFYDQTGKFRFSFIKKNWGEKGANKYTSWKRFTFFVNPEETNKTFKKRLTECSFKDLKSVEEAFSVEALTKDFYNDLFKWYTWVLTDKVGITFPNDTKTSDDDRVRLEEQIIRLITRMLFVWFIKQKHLVPNELFEIEKLNTLLKDFEPQSVTSGNYYNAILQNLFFATLNKPILEREFAKLVDKRDIKARYRYAEMFQISEEEILTLFRPVPFLNGGLFECLDKELSTDGVKYHLDGFSRNAEKAKNGNFKHRAFIPNSVFFGDGTNEGLLPLLERYNFTVEENVPNEMEVALDPELLGNVFENLLGAFNPETKDSARKQSGSFYTPKEIVAYMADESLISYLENNLPEVDKLLIRSIFEEETLSVSLQNDFELCKKIENELRKVKILDPACGSGAFPMGVLNRLVEILEKLDVQNKQSHYDLKLHLIQECIYGVDIQTIASQISKLRFFISLIVEQEKVDYTKPEENYGVWTLPNLETKFVTANTLIGLEDKQEIHLLDLKDEHLQKLQEQLLKIREEHFYAKSASKKVELRKQDEDLRAKIVDYLLQNATQPNQECINEWKSDIQKLELEKEKYKNKKIVEKQTPNLFGEIDIIKEDVNQQKRKDLDIRIKNLKTEIEKEERKSIKVGFEGVVQKVSQWNPYDQNASSPFFDMKWMFGVEEGFDIVIGNPPYIQLQKEGGKLAKLYENEKFETFAKTGDIYALFYEKGWQILKSKGVLAYITSNKWMRAGYGESLRKFFAEKTNPLQLIDFGGVQVFDSATVDTNILLFAKENNTFSTRACVIKEKELKKMSDYFRQNATICKFSSAESWVILSEKEQRIKAKIEAVGVPLKDWDINIYRGILTGFNEAFIIDGNKRNEILANCKTDEERQKTDELIRPILRGRDIKRYGYDFADLWLINTHNGVKEKAIKPINIEDYPAIKSHLNLYYDKLKKRADKGDTPYNLRNCAYIEEFSKQKIVYQELTQGSCFYFDKNAEYLVSNTGYLITGKHLHYLLTFLNSKFIEYSFRRFYSVSLGEKGLRWLAQYMEKLPIIQPTKEIEQNLSKLLDINNYNEIDKFIYHLYNLTNEEIELIEKSIK
ncbi:Eco57I restriction-modification methylase domain-containing protein [Capnocytophaga canis]|uniref:Eco57I restriction-modification methylase domain-containing protein n=3 Tax=Capnocytophaga canis TaxID=1848903 RepID=UPI001562C133|nr:Eco57I restriction-modification methylase domain-containing protein [Capnocytophaga canis]